MSGHRFGTAEFESILTEDPDIAEAAVVGYPHPIKGQGVYAYVIVQAGSQYSDMLQTRLQKRIRTSIGSIAKVDIFQFSKGLPKTRSGKVMRRILRKIAEETYDNLGDISTLADPSIVKQLIQEHKTLR